MPKRGFQSVSVYVGCLCRILVIRSVAGRAERWCVPSVDEAPVYTSSHLQLTLHLDAARGHGLARGVGRLAHVRATVLGVGVQDIQGHEAEIVGCAEAMACNERSDRLAGRFY